MAGWAVYKNPSDPIKSGNRINDEFFFPLDCLLCVCVWERLRIRYALFDGTIPRYCLFDMSSISLSLFSRHNTFTFDTANI